MTTQISARLLLSLLVFCAATPESLASGFKFKGNPFVVDGDSLIFDGREVRLLCLDAVELHQSCLDSQKSPYPCGEKARDAMAALTKDASVTCLGHGLDAYNRPLTFCRVGKKDLSREMVRQGWAIGTCRDTRKIAKQAKEEKRGLWKGPFQRPATWRKKNPYVRKDDILLQPPQTK